MKLYDLFLEHGKSLTRSSDFLQAMSATKPLHYNNKGISLTQHFSQNFDENIRDGGNAIFRRLINKFSDIEKTDSAVKRHFLMLLFNRLVHYNIINQANSIAFLIDDLVEPENFALEHYLVEYNGEPSRKRKITKPILQSIEVINQVLINNKECCVETRIELPYTLSNHSSISLYVEYKTTMGAFIVNFVKKQYKNKEKREVVVMDNDFSEVEQAIDYWIIDCFLLPQLRRVLKDYDLKAEEVTQQHFDLYDAIVI